MPGCPANRSASAGLSEVVLCNCSTAGQGRYKNIDGQIILTLHCLSFISHQPWRGVRYDSSRQKKIVLVEHGDKFISSHKLLLYKNPGYRNDCTGFEGFTHKASSIYDMISKKQIYISLSHSHAAIRIKIIFISQYAAPTAILFQYSVWLRVWSAVQFVTAVFLRCFAPSRITKCKLSRRN